jgi:hypothetical protein
MNDAVSYIIKFLLGTGKAEALHDKISYTSDTKEFGRYDLVIVPASSLCYPAIRNDMPALPLSEMEGVPLLFGTPCMERVDNTLVVYADIIASSFFLLTRYEEIRRRDVRDSHGRFPGKESLPFRAGFTHRPVVDEYGKLLRGWLRRTGADAPEPEPGIRKIWLTHDVDAPFFCRSWRNLLRETLKGTGFRNAWKLFNQPLEEDPYHTYPWLIEQDNTVRQATGEGRCESIFFIKSGGKAKEDKPVYDLYSRGLQSLFGICRGRAAIGLHSSYSAGKEPGRIAAEKESLQKASGTEIIYNRHHYLSLREPEDYAKLEQSGITADFTMGYADVAGFRLGTCRPVRWIEPETGRVSSLTLYPLNVMDVSLSDPRYMNLDYDDALSYCLKLFEQVALFGGELTLLWHNDTVAGAWHKQLYTTLTQELAQR